MLLRSGRADYQLAEPRHLGRGRGSPYRRKHIPGARGVGGLAVPAVRNEGELGQFQRLAKASDVLDAVYNIIRLLPSCTRKPSSIMPCLMAATTTLPPRCCVPSMDGRVSILRATSVSDPKHALASMGEIRAILDALRARDPDAAQAACVLHNRNAGRTALAVMACNPGEP